MLEKIMQIFKGGKTEEKTYMANDLLQNPIMKEKWIDKYMEIPITHIDPDEIDDMNKKIKNLLSEKLGEKLHGPALDLYDDEDDILEDVWGKEIEINRNEEYLIINFVDNQNSDQGSEYKSKFSPIQTLTSNKIIPWLESEILEIFDLENRKHDWGTKFLPEKEEITLMRTDGIRKIEYPLQKRIKLHKEDPEIDDQLFGTIDDITRVLPKVIVLGEERPEMDSYSEKVKEVLQEENVEELWETAQEQIKERDLKLPKDLSFKYNVDSTMATEDKNYVEDGVNNLSNLSKFYEIRDVEFSDDEDTDDQTLIEITCDQPDIVVPESSEGKFYNKISQKFSEQIKQALKTKGYEAELEEFEKIDKD